MNILIKQKFTFACLASFSSSSIVCANQNAGIITVGTFSNILFQKQQKIEMLMDFFIENNIQKAYLIPGIG